MMKDYGFIFFIVVSILCIVYNVAKFSSVYTANKIRQEVINELCQKQQYDFCKVKEVIYMEKFRRK